MSTSEPGLEIEHSDDVTVVRLLGEHDMASAPSLRQKLQGLTEDGHGIVADLSDTEFVDLAVIRALLACDEELRRQGRRLVLQVGGQHSIRRLFELAELREQFALAEDRDTADALARQQLEEPG